jgi:hypothetical protein
LCNSVSRDGIDTGLIPTSYLAGSCSGMWAEVGTGGAKTSWSTDYLAEEGTVTEFAIIE